MSESRIISPYVSDSYRSFYRDVFYGSSSKQVKERGGVGRVRYVGLPIGFFGDAKWRSV